MIQAITNHQSSTPNYWSPTVDEMLKVMLHSGNTARQIAEVIGRTRNAVLGRVHRLRVEGVEGFGPQDYQRKASAQGVRKPSTPATPRSERRASTISRQAVVNARVRRRPMNLLDLPLFMWAITSKFRAKIPVNVEIPRK